MTKQLQVKKIGYVIASEHEDYLGVFKKTPQGSVRKWAATPETAKVYKTRTEASKILKKLDLSYRAWVLELWENETQLLVSSISETDKPQWLTDTAAD